MSNVKNKFLIILLILLLGCSFGLGGDVWNDLSEDLEKAKARKNAQIIFSTQKKFEDEIQNNKKILVESPTNNKDWTDNNFSSNNYIPHLSYKNKKNLIFKSKKIGKNHFNILNSDFEPLLENEILYFYDPGGSIFSYSVKQKKLNWKFNFYKNRFKNRPKILNISISLDSLIVSDNFGYVYNLNKNTGEIVWAQNFGVPFRSNIKIDGDNIFLINQDNKFYVISKKNGKQKLDLETFPSFLKTDTKTNISLDKDNKNVYFVTSGAEIYSLNYKNRSINWLFNLTNLNIDQQVDLFFSSPLILKNNQIILSSTLSTFSMDATNGVLNWEIPVSTHILPIVLGDYIFLGTNKGFILNLNRDSGKVIWSRNIFSKLKKLKYEKTGDITSILFLSETILVTSENGYLIFLDYQDGQIINYTKISSGFFSKPIVSNENIIIIDNKMRILKFN